MAIRETGRMVRTTAVRGCSRLIVYPERLCQTDLMKSNRHNRGGRSVFIDYGGGRESGIQFVRFACHLALFLRGCLSIEFYMLSVASDGKYALVTAVMGKLLGIPVTIYDFGFRSGFEQKMRRRINSVARNRIGGDVTLLGEHERMPDNISFRREEPDGNAYQRFQKNRGVPQVIVYGDFNNSQVVALARRAHDIIKQKYPRTEFMLTSFDSEQVDNQGHNWGGSFYLCQPNSEGATMKLFEQADMVLLLSAGGLNRYFVTRAKAARFPVITNGISYINDSDRPDGMVTVVRDSYSSLAAEIVKLVDDEEYYRGAYQE